MKHFMRIVILLLTFFAITLQAQHDALVRHWTFEETMPTHFKEIINGTIEAVKLEDGIKGNGLLLGGSDVYLEIKDGVDLMNDFTLSFWFKPNELNANQTLFYQFKEKIGDYNVRNFVRLEIEAETFLLKSEKGRFNLKSIPLTLDTWYCVSYMYDGTNTKLYLQGELIYETAEAISFYDKQSYATKNRLFIGRNHTVESQLKGIVDEIMVFQKAISDEAVSVIFEEHNPVRNIVQKTTEPEIQDQISKIGPLANSDILGDNNVIYVSEYNVLEPLIVRTTGLTLEYYQIKGDKNMQFTITHNDQILGKPHNLAKTKQNRGVALKIGSENSLTFEGFQIKKNQKCTVRVNVKSGGNIISTYDLELDKNNVVLPIAYIREKDENPKNHKIITVNSTNIEIQIKDNSKVDGDIITIKQEGATILDNYLLTTDLKTIGVELKKNQQNEFAFVPIDMGSASGENTALVLILVNGEVIYDFSLRSIDVNHPARLTIIHEDF